MAVSEKNLHPGPHIDVFTRDARGRTPLFELAEAGNKAEVEAMIFSLRGTGFCSPRCALLEIMVHEGLTAADAAERKWHAEIAALLRSEQARMEMFE